jgi:peptide/nickel transport system substrate-binding protein
MLQKNPALLNPKVRQALHLAIDKKKMVKYLRNNTVIAAENGFCSPAVGNGINSVTRYSFQLEKAKQLLANAGYPNAVGIPKIELATTSDYADLMEFIQHEWQKLGVNCEVTVVQKGTFSESTSKCQISIFRKSWLADHTHPENFYALFSTNYFTPNGPNYTHFSSIKYDSLYIELSQKNQPQELEHLSNQLEELIANETPVIPLYYDQVMHFVSKRISQFPTNSVNMLDLRRVRKN